MTVITEEGGFIGAKPDWLGKRSGVWSLQDQYDLQKLSSWPIPLGTEFGGGYVGGYITYGTESWLPNSSGKSYLLIVAPKASGESSTTKQYKTSLALVGTPLTTSSAGSLWDGYHNTYTSAMGSGTQHPAANFCQGLSINGYSDWYLPATQEIDIAFGNLAYLSDWMVGGTEAFKNSGSSFNNGGFYWTSREETSAGATSWFTDAMGGYANIVGGMTKTETLWVRAIRRIPYTI